VSSIPVAINIVITSLESASTHKVCQPSRTRKLLLHKKEINKLIGFTQVKHQTLIPTKVYFKKDLVKLQFALAKGKKQYDKRQCEKEKTWKLEQSRIAKYSNKC
jgi:SsrA-binding protein